MDPISDATLLEREIDESLLHQLDQELRDVEAARLRVAAGSYGRCDVCGTAIADDRLRAVPATTRARRRPVSHLLPNVHTASGACPKCTAQCRCPR